MRSSKRLRRVELQIEGGDTLQGLLKQVPRKRGGHYVLWSPKLVVGSDATDSLTGHVEIPRERVLWFTVLD